MNRAPLASATALTPRGMGTRAANTRPVWTQVAVPTERVVNVHSRIPSVIYVFEIIIIDKQQHARHSLQQFTACTKPTGITHPEAPWPLPRAHRTSTWSARPSAA